MAVGFQNVTSDAAVKAAGVAVIIHSIHIVSGGSAGVVILRSGSTVSGTQVIKETGSTSTGKTLNFPGGIMFGSGCFVDVDANVTSVLVGYERV